MHNGRGVSVKKIGCDMNAERHIYIYCTIFESDDPDVQIVGGNMISSQIKVTIK